MKGHRFPAGPFVTIAIIVACSENRIIGKEGGLPWSIPEDTAYFRNQVKGGVVIEGRRCFEETGEAFPESDTIVLSRDPLFSPRVVLTAISLPLALELAQGLEGKGPATASPIRGANPPGFADEALHNTAIVSFLSG